MKTKERLPDWFRQRIRVSEEFNKVLATLDEFNLNTVCESACCPNRGKCYSRGTATFMILGNVCTRNCRFCAVENGIPKQVDDEEAGRISMAVKKLGLKYVVMTSVTRDDLADGGAVHFAGTIRRLKSMNPGIKIEVLIPDFLGSEESLKIVADAGPDVIGHNIETVKRLYPHVRPQAVYERSLKVLECVKMLNAGVLTKSGLMLGLGETEGEVKESFTDISNAGCDILTLGQYLRPSPQHLDVAEYIHPEQFGNYRKTALLYGFKEVVSAPLVRSSYNALEIWERAHE